MSRQTMDVIAYPRERGEGLCEGRGHFGRNMRLDSHRSRVNGAHSGCSVDSTVARSSSSSSRPARGGV